MDDEQLQSRLALADIRVPLDVIEQWRPYEVAACVEYLRDQAHRRPPACLAEYVLDRNEGHLDLWGI